MDGAAEYVVIATTGKGERLDRPELEQIEAALRAGGQGLMIMEDLGRLCRGIEAVRLFGVAVDHGTRAISPNDAAGAAPAVARRRRIASNADDPVERPSGRAGSGTGFRTGGERP